MRPFLRPSSAYADPLCCRVKSFSVTGRHHSGDLDMKLFHLTVLFFADAAIAGPSRCNECVGTDAASCLSKQKDDQYCASDKDSLGTTHCASAVGKYLDYYDKEGNITDLFFQGCFDCSSKKEACFALGGFLKGDKRWTLLQCDIECCTGNNCNNQFPALSENAITVFTPNASGPTKCYKCLTSDADACLYSQDDQTCSSDSDSLGTTHCGSGMGRVRDKDGNIRKGFFRSCINCADKKAACAAIGGYLKDEEGFTLLECKIECCTGNFCNGQLVPTTSMPSTKGDLSMAPCTLAMAPSTLANSGFLAFVLTSQIILHQL